MSNEITLYLPPPPPSIRPSLQGAASQIKFLSGFVTTYVARQAKKRDADIQKFASDVIETINDQCRKVKELDEAVHNKVDDEHFWSDEFFDRFRATTEHHASSPDEKKRKYLIDFVFRYALEKRPDVILERIFWRYVSGITGTHLVILDELYAKQAELNTADLSVLRTSPGRPELVSLKQLSHSVCEDDILLQCLLADLKRDGLVEQIAGPVNHEDSSNRVLLQPPGHSLMRFIFGDWE